MDKEIEIGFAPTNSTLGWCDGSSSWHENYPVRAIATAQQADGKKIFLCRHCINRGHGEIRSLFDSSGK